MDADAQPVQAEQAGQRFSEWLKSVEIKRTAARELLQGLGIKPTKIRVPGISAAVVWLTPEQITVMNAAAARVAAGESVASVCAGGPAEDAAIAPVSGRERSRPDADSMMRLLGGLLQAHGGAVPSSPLSRARAMREAAQGGLRLTTAELAELTGRHIAGIERMRSGSRLQGYRLWRLPGTAADPETVWMLSEASGPRAVGDPLRSPGREEPRQDADRTPQ